VNLQEIPYFRFWVYTELFLYADNWATQNSKLYIETKYIYCSVLKNLLTA